MVNKALVSLLILIHLLLSGTAIACWKDVFTDFSFSALLAAICLTIISLLPFLYFYDERSKEETMTANENYRLATRVMEVVTMNSFTDYLMTCKEDYWTKEGWDKLFEKLKSITTYVD